MPKLMIRPMPLKVRWMVRIPIRQRSSRRSRKPRNRKRKKISRKPRKLLLRLLH